MVLHSLQMLLEDLYDVELRHDVYDFLVTDRRAVAGCELHNEVHDAEEELLLAETADGAGIALYLHPDLLCRLEAADPRRALTEENLADYCTALEGVSHFVYSTWRLESDLPVSLLELETQAEVDKYAVTVFLMGSQQDGASYPTQVHARLFDRVRFDSRLDPDQYERYRTAHSLAAQYCRRLERRFVHRGVARIEAMVRELRTFYRLTHTAKLRHALA
ncbi:MAG TPA: hypothetical protein VGI65_20525 [Steroidobacteraceae bacterium]|jgi:hypothetical protein